MRVLFIYPVPRPSNKIYTGYHVGIGSLAAAVKAAGHKVALYVAERFDRDALLAAVDRFAPNASAISATSPQMTLAHEIINALHEETALPVIAGGVGVTVQPARLQALPNVVAQVMGEGEGALPELLDRLAAGTDLAGVANVVLPGEPPPERLSVIQDLDTLPIDDREIFGYQRILDRNRPTVGLEAMASRGCPFGCGYCANRRLNQLTGVTRVRYRGVGHVMRELRMLLDRYTGVRIVGFHDDIFGLDKAWLADFAATYPRDVGLPFWCNLRIGTFRDQDLETLRDAGCFRVHIGVESGSDRIRRNVLDRPFTDAEIVEGFRAIRGAGLKALAFFMLGLPDETEDDLAQTIELARRIKPDWSVVSLFTPYPGTKLGDAHETGDERSFSETYYDESAVYPGVAAPADTVRRYYRDFVKRVYGERT